LRTFAGARHAQKQDAHDVMKSRKPLFTAVFRAAERRNGTTTSGLLICVQTTLQGAQL
jgi:hypothetical protein